MCFLAAKLNTEYHHSDSGLIPIRGRMGEKEYVVYLSPERADRFRYYHVPEHGIILRFCIQYEALTGGEWKAIVRYDTARHHPHKNILRPDGTQKKQEYRGYIPMEDSLLEN